MKYAPTETSPCKRVFAVELTGHEVAHMREHALASIAERADLPGFRKGKVPAQVLAARFGRAVEEEAVQEAVNHAARQVLDETGLAPAVNPTVENVKRSGEGMTFDLVIELAPEIALGEYRGFALRRDAVMVRPEDVDAVVDGLRNRQVVFTAVDRPARWGDLAVLDYDGTVDGRPFEGSSARDVLIHIGNGETMRALEHALVGMKAGETGTVPVPYSADHVNPALAGKTASITVTLKEVKETKAPALDDRFARAAGEYGSLEELRRAVALRLRAEREREAAVRLRARVADRLMRYAPAEPTPTLVEQEMQFMAVRGAEELARQGIRAIEQMRMTGEQFRELFRPAASRAVREAFVLEEIARRERLEVTDEQLTEEIRAAAGPSAMLRAGPEQGRGAGGGRDLPERVLSAMKTNGRWERLRRRLLQDRTLDWIIAESNVTEHLLVV